MHAANPAVRELDINKPKFSFREPLERISVDRGAIRGCVYAANTNN